MAGLSGSTSTSTTGARSRSMPAAAMVAPIARPAAKAWAGSSVAPMAAALRVGREAVGRGQAADQPALLVDGDAQRTVGRGTQRGGQAGQLGRGGDVAGATGRLVAAEQDDPAQSAGQGRRDARVGLELQATETDQEHAGRQAADRRLVEGVGVGAGVAPRGRGWARRRAGRGGRARRARWRERPRGVRSRTTGKRQRRATGGQAERGGGDGSVVVAPRAQRRPDAARGSAGARVLDFRTCRGVAQSGSAPVWGTGGRRFKSGRPDHISRTKPASGRFSRSRWLAVGGRRDRLMASTAMATYPLATTASSGSV